MKKHFMDHLIGWIMWLRWGRRQLCCASPATTQKPDGFCKGTVILTRDDKKTVTVPKTINSMNIVGTVNEIPIFVNGFVAGLQKDLEISFWS